MKGILPGLIQDGLRLSLRLFQQALCLPLGALQRFLPGLGAAALQLLPQGERIPLLIQSAQQPGVGRHKGDVLSFDPKGGHRFHPLSTR
ncbi:hypothetical protein SDC9_84777 [bioreactor metagenome]|uniref:Uncharacterized protein n=1 Tax=bioreactor metagenome TaxID=1076179 RepID=A0A644ZB83_9ZZZZ